MTVPAERSRDRCTVIPQDGSSSDPHYGITAVGDILGTRGVVIEGLPVSVASAGSAHEGVR